MEVTREQALRHRAARQELGAAGPRADAAVLDAGVQDTGGPRAARWALAVRGCDIDDADLLYAWTLRGAPHAYRRAEAAAVARATAPYDEADAGKRIFDAAAPLRAADLAITDALATLAREFADLVDTPTVKGEASAALTARLPEPYLRWCKPCQATHPFEQPFRLAALQAGLEIEPDTSPPVLRPIEGWDGPAPDAPPHLDPIRAMLRLHGPTTPKLVAEELDAPVRTVKQRWPEDTVAVTVDGQARQILADDAELLADPPATDRLLLLGAFDPWLQARDRALLVADQARRKALWPALGRPGAVVVGADIVGTWRPRSKGDTLRLRVERWDGAPLPPAFEEQAERLAAHRGQRFGGVTDR